MLCCPLFDFILVIKRLVYIGGFAKESAQLLYNMGIINGFEVVGRFAPKEKLTRYQMAAIMDSTLKKMEFKRYLDIKA